MYYLVALTVLLLPTYPIRFELFGLPTNVLMVWVFVVWAAFFGYLVRNNDAKRFIRSLSYIDNKLIIALELFSLAGAISLFVGGMSLDKLGQYLVLFVQPIGMFFIVHYLFLENPARKSILIKTFYLFIAGAGLYAALQYLTLLGLPSDWWGNSNEPKRAISFFEHPNGFALFMAPLLAYVLPDVLYRVRSRLHGRDWIAVAAWLVGAMGLFLSLSRGGWLGLLAAIGIYVVIAGDKRYIAGALVGLAILSAIVFAQPNFRYRLLLPFHGEKSSVARISLWHTGSKMVKDNPILGKGITGFSANWDRYNADLGLDHYNFPHNIVLNFWVDAGLLGAASFLALCLYGLLLGLRQRASLRKAGLALFIIALVVHGIIDIPYLKNDLAMLFWMVYAMSIS